MTMHKALGGIAILLGLVACKAPPAVESKGQESASLPSWRAIGTEPFWGVTVQGAELLFTTPEDPSGKLLQGEYTERPEGGAHYDGVTGGVDFSLDIHHDSCGDGMSDKHYEWTARFRYGEVEYEGCAEAAVYP